MTRDILDRLALFSGGVEVKRLALNMEQIDEYQPPPNPAKTTDSRYLGYIDLYGEESWELDALEPAVMSSLIEDAVLALRDDAIYQEMIEQETEEKRLLAAISRDWEAVAEFVGGLDR